MTVQIQMRLGEWANKHQGDPIWGQGAALDDVQINENQKYLEIN